MRAATFTLALVLTSCVALLHASPHSYSSSSCYPPVCRIIEGQEFRCKDINNWHEYYRHPTNKHLYVQCTGSGPMVRRCAPGTAWGSDTFVNWNGERLPDCKRSRD